MEKLQHNNQLENSLILAEYQSLRKEILSRLSRVFRLQQSLLLGTLIYATTFIFPKLSNVDALNQIEIATTPKTTILYYVFLFMLPLITFVVELICTSEQDAIYRTGVYIKENIEQVYKTSTYKGWEDWLERQEKVKRRRTSESLLSFSRRYIIIPVYCLASSIICTIGFLNLSENSPSLFIKIAFWFVLFSFYITIYAIMIKKLNRAKKEELANSIYNLLVLDVDGCLLDSKRKISPLNKKAITFLKNKGITIILASGRGVQSLKPICQELNLEGHHVACHGASLFNATDVQETQLSTSLGKNDLNLIIRKLNELSLVWIAFGNQNYYCNKKDADKVKANLIYRSDLDEDKFDMIKEIKDTLSYNWEEKISKILCYVDISNTSERSKSEHLKKDLASKYKVFNSTNETLEIIHKAAYKSQGVKEIIKLYGPSEFKSLVVGDYDNDIEVLKWGHKAVAPSNASINVRKINEISVLDISNDQNLIWEIAQLYFRMDPDAFHPE